MNGMSKPVVYLETSFVSYLTGWASADEKVACDQSATRRWWERERPKWHCVVSQTVLDEAMAGDSDAVARRMAVLEGVEVMELSEEARNLADALVRAHALPEKARTDALHVALDAVRGADLLLTWNCRHIANSSMVVTIAVTLDHLGYRCPDLATPAQRLDERD